MPARALLWMYPSGNPGRGQLSARTMRYCHSLLAEALGHAVKVVSERLGHSSIGITLDTYSPVLPGLQEAAAQRFDDFLSPRAVETENVSKMLANQFETDIGVAGFEPATT